MDCEGFVGVGGGEGYCEVGGGIHFFFAFSPVLRGLLGWEYGMGIGGTDQEKLVSQWDFASVSQVCVIPYLESGSRDSNVGDGILESFKRAWKSVIWDSGMEIVKGVGCVRAVGGTVLYLFAILNGLRGNLESLQMRRWKSALKDWQELESSSASLYTQVKCTLERFAKPDTLKPCSRRVVHHTVCGTSKRGLA